MTSSYTIKILTALKNGDLTLYKLSKILGSQGKRISNGSLIPVLKKLEIAGYIKSVRDDRYKRYVLTEKGIKYMESLSDVREKLKRDLLENLTKQDLFSDKTFNLDDLLFNDNLMYEIKNYIDRYGLDLNYIIIRTFILYRSGMIKRIEDFFSNSREVLA